MCTRFNTPIGQDVNGIAILLVEECGWDYTCSITCWKIDETTTLTTGLDISVTQTNPALTGMNQWFYINQQVLNITKTTVIKFTPQTTAHVPLDIYYKANLIEEVKALNF